MSLRHAALGLLADGPASGYDLLKIFDRSLAFIWPATQSQLYGELNRLADDGLIEVSHEGPRGRKDYTITEQGRAELERWITRRRTRPHPPQRGPAARLLPRHRRTRTRQGLPRTRSRRCTRTSKHCSRPIERDTDWDTSDFNRYGHLVIESGRRYAHGQAPMGALGAHARSRPASRTKPPHRPADRSCDRRRPARRRFSRSRPTGADVPSARWLRPTPRPSRATSARPRFRRAGSRTARDGAARRATS